MADVTGTTGNDTLGGTGAADNIYGLGGDDSIDAGDGDDVVEGGSGNDTLYIGVGRDTLRGGDGNDAMYAANSVASAGLITSGDVFDGGAGSDRITIDFRIESIALNLDFSTMIGAAAGTANGALFYAIEDLWAEGSSLNDTIIVGRGNVGAARLYGHDGDDYLQGGILGDYAVGGRGADIMYGDDGNDRLYGDTDATLFAGGNDRIYGGAGDDILSDNYGDDQLSGDDGNDSLTAGIGNDTLLGGAGTDTLDGGDGNDVLSGGDGNDLMLGGLGSNEFIGGTGNDTYIVTATTTGEAVLNSLVEFAGEGADEVRVTASVFSLEWFGTSYLERLTVTNAANHAALIGNALDNIITGSTGVDDLFGRAGNDTLRGGTGAANTLVGNEGDDIYFVQAIGDSTIEFAGQGTDSVQTSIQSFTLAANVENLAFVGTGGFTGIGNAEANSLRAGVADDFLSGLDGDDIIVGASGSDTLQGGSGADQFRYEGAETGYDRILDFVGGTDKIALRSSYFTPTANIAFVAGAGAVATTANSTFIHDTTTGIVYYDDDGNGAGAAVAIAQLNAGQTVVASDFVFY